MKLTAGIISFLLFATFSAFGQKTIDSQPLENASIKNNSNVKREVFDAAKYPALMAVGRIDFLGESWCSIILVAEDVAVTAGHCFLKANVKFNLTRDLTPFHTAVLFKTKDGERIEGICVKRVIKATMNPDYAIVRLNKKIPESVIKPLKISNLTLAEIRSSEDKLGCAGFNGDKELGSDGLLLTISRNVKIISENSSKERIDTSCFSTYGGSGGLFYRARHNDEKNVDEYDFIGVIWGMTDEKLNEKGELVKAENIITSITPVSVFYDELTSEIEKK